MRWWILAWLCAVAPASLGAAAWGLDYGLALSTGASRFAGEPTPLPPPTDPNSLFAVFPPTATGSGSTGLAGSAGLSLTLTHQRRFNATLELLADTTSQIADATLTFPDGTVLHRTQAFSPAALPKSAEKTRSGTKRPRK